MLPPDADRYPLWRFPEPVAEGRVIGGVAGGVAVELGLDAVLVRIAFVVLAAAAGWGFLLYGVLWALMALRLTRGDVRIVDARQRHGAAPGRGRTRTHRLVGFVLVVFGLLLFIQEVGGPFFEGVVWPLALFGAGVGIAHEQGVDLPMRTDRLLGTEGDRSGFLLRAAAGGVVVLAGIGLAVSLNFDFATARDSMLVVGLVVAGLGLVLAPWATGLVNDLGAERRARIRADERAKVTSHLHDSVLQTLSLIQRRSTDAEVVGLARRQERELRHWLFGRGEATPSASFRTALAEGLAEIEELHLVPVEVVVVGDTPVDGIHRELLAATREAVANAAKHAGVDRIDVFAEVGDVRTEVFVRDTGIGFDPTAVPQDRRGIADSIKARLERVGGRVQINSDLGVGTEVEMAIGGER